MTQLLAHLVGDYVLQSHVMATRKTSSWAWALVHAAFYTLPFLFLTTDPWRLAVIGGTHAVIDRYRLAGLWCAAYGVGFPGVWHTGLRLRARFSGAPLPVFDPPPPFLGVWLIIIVDNTMHMLINYAVLS